MLIGLVQSLVMLRSTRQRTAIRGQLGVVVLWIPVLAFIVIASLVSGMLRFFRGTPAPNWTDHEPKTKLNFEHGQQGYTVRDVGYGAPDSHHAIARLCAAK